MKICGLVKHSTCAMDIIYCINDELHRKRKEKALNEINFISGHPKECFKHITKEMIAAQYAYEHSKHLCEAQGKILDMHQLSVALDMIIEILGARANKEKCLEILSNELCAHCNDGQGKQCYECFEMYEEKAKIINFNN